MAAYVQTVMLGAVVVVFRARLSSRVHLFLNMSEDRSASRLRRRHSLGALNNQFAA